MNGLRVFALLVAACLCGGCGGCKKPPSIPASPVMMPTLPTAAQPKLPTTKLWLGAEEMITELALTGEQRQAGMMFRTNMAENEGMLFVFPEPYRASFWMMNTRLPLSAAYISPEGVVLEIHDLQPHDTNSVVAASDQVQFVLETRQGWFEWHHIGTNTLVRTERGSLQNSFSGKR